MGISVFPAPSGGLTQKVFTYTTPGLSTFTLPSGFGVGNPLMADVTILGGGGGAGVGFWSSTSSGGAAGGGGGGGIFNRTIPLTANMNVMVGRGGGIIAPAELSQDGGNGGVSYIGNGSPKNLFINPTFGGLERSKGSSEIGVSPPFTSTNPLENIPPAYFGNSAQLQNVSSIQGKSQLYPVLPSTGYAFSLHFRTDSGNSVYRLLMNWYDSSYTFISTTTGSDFTNSTGWTQQQVGATSPSNAAYVRLRWQFRSSDNTTYVSNAMLESGTTTASSYVDGYTTGYSWAGHPFGSVTLLNSETMYTASGGGGGKGINSSGGNYGVAGFAGACSGGGGINVGSSGNMHAGGAGGGLGGNAERALIVIPNGNDSTDVSYFDASFEYNRHREFSSGTFGMDMGGGTNRFPGPSVGGPANSEGYGAGGTGAQFYKSSGNGYLSIGETDSNAARNRLRLMISGKDNSGAGGSATNLKFSDTAITSMAGAGGSGLVIIKYWS